MKKYFQIAELTFQSYFAFRVSFVFWRLQNFISFLVFYYLWVAVSKDHSHFGVYTQAQLYAYFIIGYIIKALVFTSKTADLGGQIVNGSLSTSLVKPIGQIKRLLAIDSIDKIFNLFFLIFEFSFILFCFHPILTLPSSLNAILFIYILVIAIASFFFYSLIISTLTFWVDQPWSTRYLFGVVFINLFSGQVVPLDLLPSLFIKVLNLTPFPYLYYYPLRIWLGLETNPLSIIFSATVVFIFSLLFSLYLWRRGLINYQSYGN